MKNTLNRIEQLQNAHTWLLEEEATHLLVAIYAAYTNGFGYEGKQLQEAMDHSVQRLCEDKRSNIIDVLRKTGGLK